MLSNCSLFILLNTEDAETEPCCYICGMLLLWLKACYIINQPERHWRNNTATFLSQKHNKNLKTGSTEIQNLPLVFICFPCHTLVHSPRWNIQAHVHEAGNCSDWNAHFLDDNACVNAVCEHRKTSAFHFTQLCLTVVILEDPSKASTEPPSVRRESHCFQFPFTLTTEGMFLCTHPRKLIHTRTSRWRRFCGCEWLYHR